MRRLKRYLWSSSRTTTNGADVGSNGNSDKNNRHDINSLFAVQQQRTISHTSSSSSIKQHENMTSCTDTTVGSKARMFLNLPLLRNGLWMRKICPLVSAAERRLRGLLQQGVKRHEGRVDTVGEERKKTAAGFFDLEETDHEYGEFNLQTMDDYDYDSILSKARKDNCSYHDCGGSQTKTILVALFVGCMLLTSVTTFVVEGTKALFLIRPLRGGPPTRRRTKIINNEMMIMPAEGASDDHLDVPADVTTSLRTILLFLTRALLFSAFVACLYTLALQIAQPQRSIVARHVCDKGSDKDTGFFNRTNCGEHHGKRTDGVNCTGSTSGCGSSSIILLKLGILVAFAAFVGGVVGPSSTPPSPRKHGVKKDEPLREEGREDYDYDKASQQDYYYCFPPREKLLTLLPLPPPRPLPSPADYGSSHKHALPPPSRGGSTCSCVTSHHCCTSHFLTPRRDLAHTTNGNASCHTHATTNLSSSWRHRCCSTAKEVVGATAALFLLFMCPFYSSKREYCRRNNSLLGQKKKCTRRCGADEHQQKEPRHRQHLYPPLLRLGGAAHNSKVCGVVGSTHWPSASSFSSHAAPCSPFPSPSSSRWRPSSSNYSSCNYIRLSVHTVALFCLLNVDNCQYKHLHDLVQNSSSEIERAVVGGASEYSSPSQTAGVKGASELMSSWSIFSLLSSSFLHSYYTAAAATPSLVAYVGLLAPVFWITLCFYTRQTGW